jgi:hypothetical protein
VARRHRRTHAPPTFRWRNPVQRASSDGCTTPMAPPKTPGATEAPPKVSVFGGATETDGTVQNPRRPRRHRTEKFFALSGEGRRKAPPTKQEPQWSFFGGAGRCRASHRPLTGRLAGGLPGPEWGGRGRVASIRAELYLGIDSVAPQLLGEMGATNLPKLQVRTLHSNNILNMIKYNS